MERERGKRLFLKIFVDENMFNELYNPWQEAVVIKLLGKNVGYKVMKNWLMLLQKFTDDFDSMDVDNGYFMVKIDLEIDRYKMIGGP